MREHVDSWNDARLDELARGVKDGFAKVDARFDKVEGEMKAGFAKVDHEMKAGFAKVDQKMESGFADLRTANERLYRMLFVSAISIVVTLIAALAAALTT